MKHEGGSGAGSVMFAFLLGGIVGSALTLFLSPLSGPEARRRLTDLKDDIAEKTDEYTHEVKEKVDETVHKGKDFIDKKKSVVSSALEAGKEAYRKEREKHETP